MKLAVYGTVRSGNKNTGILENSALVYPGHHTFPAVIQNKNGSGTVVEVHDGTKEDLARQDMYEGIDSGLYRRVKADIKMDHGDTENVWLYVAGDDLMRSSNSCKGINSGYWYNTNV